MWRSIVPAATVLHASASVWTLFAHSAPFSLLVAGLGAILPSLLGIAASIVSASVLPAPERFSPESDR
jgi:hypothetical protein